MKTRKFLLLLLSILVLLTLLFIWGNSLDSKEESSAKSNRILAVFAPVLEVFIGEGNITDHLIRKIAHFVEFGALGSELALLCVLLRRVRLQAFLNCLFAGLAAAVIDEALQLISSRGSQVQDVLLDFCGVLTGILLVLLLYCIVAFFLSRRKKYCRPNCH